MTRRRPGNGVYEQEQYGVSAADVPLEKKFRAATKKTLYEIAGERESQLSPGNGDAKIITVLPPVDGEEKEFVSPVLDTFFLAASLAALHFTLEVLTVHQYAQDLRFSPIFGHTLLVAWPTLFFAIHLVRGHLLPFSRVKLSDHARQRIAVARQTLFLVTANVAGCYLIRLTNEGGYYAVMKKAPSVGTIWVWCVLELGLVGAMAGVAGPGLYAWYYSYGLS